MYMHLMHTIGESCVFVCKCVCACLCERESVKGIEREKGRESESESESLCVHLHTHIHTHFHPLLPHTQHTQKRTQAIATVRDTCTCQRALNTYQFRALLP